MNPINQGITALNSGIDASVAYVQENGMVILVLLAIAYFLRNGMF